MIKFLALHQEYQEELELLRTASRPYVETRRIAPDRGYSYERVILTNEKRLI